ncbi:MAG: MarR family transcriptional regulator [Armatimonadia bacterium]|nr:MarR family transcriptional regulator [Armatimonadia bacterium]
MARSAPEDEAGQLPKDLERSVDAVLVFNLVRTHGYVSPYIDQTLKAGKLTGAQFNTLLALGSAGDEGMLMGEIGERLVVSKSNVTGLIDRLEKHGLVERCETPDRRATRVRLTSEGRAALYEVLPAYRGAVCELTDCLSPAEKASLIELLTKLRRELRRKWREAKGS